MGHPFEDMIMRRVTMKPYCIFHNVSVGLGCSIPQTSRLRSQYVETNKHIMFEQAFRVSDHMLYPLIRPPFAVAGTDQPPPSLHLCVYVCERKSARALLLKARATAPTTYAQLHLCATPTLPPPQLQYCTLPVTSLQSMYRNQLFPSRHQQ